MIETRLIKTEQQLGKEYELRRSQFGVIVLVTDFGDDLAAAECKLSLTDVFQENKTISPDLIVVNDVVPFNKVHAAFNFCRLSQVAPRKTIFIGVIDPGVGTDRKSVIIATEKDHYFIGPDNGIFYPAVNSERIKKIWQIDKSQFPNSSTTFHGRDIFSRVAAKLASGINPEVLGFNTNDLVKLHFQPGQILHVDAYGNLKIYGNIQEVAKGLILEDQTIVPLVNTFEDVNIGQPLAYLGSSGLLEIAIREGNAAETFGTRIGDCLRIQFE